MEILGDTQSVSNAALDIFRNLGWAPLPLVHGTKTPTVNGFTKWRRRPPEETITKWFSRERSLGVVLGPVSGGLCCRDFDTAEAFQEWRDGHRTLADTLPRSKTFRGFHCYFYADEAEVRAASPTNSRTIHGIKGNGELKINGFGVLPPSLHVEHQWHYAWEIPPWDGIPFVKHIQAAGLVPKLPPKQPPKPKEGGSHKQSPAPPPPIVDSIRDTNRDLDLRIQEAIRVTVPTCYGQRNRSIFYFARHLKAIPELRDRHALELKDHVHEWYGQAFPTIRTRDFSVTWKDFLVGWGNVERPAGEAIASIFAQTTGDDQERLTELCLLLQHLAEDKPFFLDCRTVAELFGVSHRTANKRLNRMLKRGVLRLANQHDFRKKRAREFIFQGSS